MAQRRSTFRLSVFIFTATILLSLSWSTWASSKKFTPPPPPPSPPPIVTISGGNGRQGESFCSKTPIPLRTLTHSFTSQGKTFDGGYTLDERPTLWVYVPYALNSKFTGDFQILEGQQPMTIATVTKMQPGIIGVRLPATKRLNPGDSRIWQFVLRCDPDPTKGSKNIAVRVAVQRVSKPDLEKQLKKASPVQRANLAAQNGIWYDAVTALAEARRTQPALVADWNQLLQDGGLNNLISQPIVYQPDVQYAGRQR